MRAIDLTGQIYNRLLVKEFAGLHTYPNGKTRRQWLCVCLEDGNEVVVNGNDLKNGHTKSCGCLDREKKSARKFQDLTGQTINGFRVIKRTGTMQKTEKTSTPLYLCQCLLCGKYIEQRADYLRSGDVHSCGCLVKKRESVIEQYLIDNGIDYVKGVSFKGMVSNEGFLLWIDFALFGDDGLLRCVIEEQGECHKGKSDIRAKRYAIKKEYCKLHHIPLEEIWYYEDTLSRVREISEKYLHVDPVPSLFEEGATTISKESTCLMRFQHGSAAPLLKAG